MRVVPAFQLEKGDVLIWSGIKDLTRHRGMVISVDFSVQTGTALVEYGYYCVWGGPQVTEKVVVPMKQGFMVDR